MLPALERVKGIHPGAVLKRELQLRGLRSKELALQLGEYEQTLSAIANRRRGITPRLSIELGRVLGESDEYFMLLQAYYEIETVRKQNSTTPAPDLSKIRKALFWDTDIDQIDWERQKRAVVQRVFDRGNEVEINEIINFYGSTEIKEIMNQIKPKSSSSIHVNFQRYIH